MTAKQPIDRARIWAVAGGKGGVGKSVIATAIAITLARMGKRTILVDADLDGANLHLLLGIKAPSRTLGDFLSKGIAKLQDTCLETGTECLRFVSGAVDTVALSNLTFAQKNKLINEISRLNADHVVMDLGAGASFNVIDFFLSADHKVVVLTSDPTAIQNAYGFVRSAVFRSMARRASKRSSLQALIKTAMNPKNELGVCTIKGLLDLIEASDDKDELEELKAAVSAVRPIIFTNMARNLTDSNAGRIVQLVSKKYLAVNAVAAGTIGCDRQIEAMISQMIPLTRMEASKQIFGAVARVTAKLV